MKNFEQFLKEGIFDYIKGPNYGGDDDEDPEDEMDKILDKGKLSPEDKKRLAKLGKKVKGKRRPIGYKPKEKINITDKVTYHRPGSEHDGKVGIVQRIRDDGKMTVRFEDGSRLAANPIYLVKEPITPAMKIIDPYNEEDW